MTTVFVEHPLLLPGSAYHSIGTDPTFPPALTTSCKFVTFKFSSSFHYRLEPPCLFVCISNPGRLREEIRLDPHQTPKKFKISLLLHSTAKYCFVASHEKQDAGIRQHPPSLHPPSSSSPLTNRLDIGYWIKPLLHCNALPFLK